MKISREARAGILAVLVIAVFIWLVQFLKGTNILAAGNTYYAIYNDVTGINSGTTISLNGQKVGSVTDVYFHPDNSGRSVVELNVETKFPIDKTYQAQIGAAGFLDPIAISLVKDMNADPSLVNKPLHDGDTLVSIYKTSITNVLFDQLNPIKDQLNKTMGLLDTALINIANISDPDMKGNLMNAVSQLQITLKGINNTAGSVTHLVDDNNREIKNTLNSFNQTAVGFKNFSDKLNQMPLENTLTKLDAAVDNTNQILSRMNSGEGTMGKLLTDDKLYQNLEGATAELEVLLNDLKNNPKRYVHFSVFGRKNVPYEARVDTVYLIDN